MTSVIALVTFVAGFLGTIIHSAFATVSGALVGSLNEAEKLSLIITAVVSIVIVIAAEVFASTPGNRIVAGIVLAVGFNVWHYFKTLNSGAPAVPTPSPKPASKI
jgi:hypothetical protein